jgi:hypothetical protein
MFAEGSHMRRIYLREFRTVLAIAMIVLLPFASALWVLADNYLVLSFAIAVGVLGVVAALVEEEISDSTDQEMRALELMIEEKDRQIEALRETVREDDRIVEMLEVRNNALGAELTTRSIQTEAA